MLSRKAWWIIGALCVVIFPGVLVAQMAFDAWRLTTGPSSWYVLRVNPYPSRRHPQGRPRLVRGPYRDKAACEAGETYAGFFCEQMLDADANRMPR